MSTELVILNQEEWPILNPDNEQLQILKQNLGNEQLTAQDLPKISIPYGDMKRMPDPPEFELETAVGMETIQTITGVILYTKVDRAHWSTPYSSDNEGPPDCYSTDMIHGIGIPGGLCGNDQTPDECCPHNLWGSAAIGDGKGCSTRRLFFLAIKGELLPNILRAPSTSLKPCRKYLLGLKAIPFWQIETEFKLTKGAKSVLLHPKKIGQIGDTVAKQIRTVQKQYYDLFEASQAAQQNGDGSEPTEV